MKTPSLFMKSFLFVLLLLPAVSALAQEVTILQLKRIQQEAEAAPSLAAFKESADKVIADEQRLKDRRTALNQENMAMTEQYSKSAREHLSDQAGQMEFIQSYQKKFNQLNEELRTVQSQIPDAEKQANIARRGLTIAVWERRIDDKNYSVFIAAATEWRKNKQKPDHLDKWVALTDAQGKKYYLDAPQRNLEIVSQGNCLMWLQTGEHLALRNAEMVPATADDPPMVKVTSLRAIYFLDRINKLQSDCPFGRVAEVAAPQPVQK